MASSRPERMGGTVPDKVAEENALDVVEREGRRTETAPESESNLRNRLNLLNTAGYSGKERAKEILKQFGYECDDANVGDVCEQAMEDTRRALEGLAGSEQDPRVGLRVELIAKYLPDEKERARLASGEMPLRQNEARETMQWLNDVKVERTYYDDFYYNQFFGQEKGFTHLSRSKDGEESKHEFIDRIVAEKEAHLHGLEAVMRAVGLTRDATGGLRIHALDQPQEEGEPINALLAHAFMIGMENAWGITDPDQRREAEQSVIDDVCRYLGRPERPTVEPEDILQAEGIVAPESARGFPHGESRPLEDAIRRAADEQWEQQRRASLDLGDKVRKQREEAERARGVTQPAEEVTFGQPEWVDGSVISEPEKATTPERGPVVTPETVTAAQEAHDVQRAVAPERTRWGWIVERTKGLATAGVAEFRHFFGYGRAARQESKAVEQAYDEFFANSVGITPDQRSGRIQNIVDDAELRMMKRLRDYKDQYGESVVSTGPELDQFRARLQSRLEQAHGDLKHTDRRELRDLVLGAFDPKWTRRGIYGVIELALAGCGVKLLIDRALMKATELPAAKLVKLAQKGAVVAGPAEILRQVIPPSDVAPMTRTVWDTLHHAYPGASGEQLVDASKEVIRQTQHLYEPAWADTVRHIDQIGDTAARSTRALVEGTPLHGVFSEAVKKIMGMVATRGAAGV